MIFKSTQAYDQIGKFIKQRQKLINRVLVCVAAIPPVILVLLLIKYSVNVPFWDSWELVPLFEKIKNGTVGFGDFFAQHNEHRILFPRLIMAGLALMTQWNSLYEIATNVVLASISFVFIFLILKNTFKDLVISGVALVVISIIFFSPIQFENWMWGWQIQWFLNVLGLVVAAWALSTPKASPVLRLIIAIVAAAVATYSLASGFFVWLVCAPIIWFSKDLKKYLWVWFIATFFVVGSHYIGYHDPQYHPSKILFLTQPLELMRYFAVYISRPIVIDFLISLPMAILYIGTIVGLIYTVIKYNSKLFVSSLLPWLAVGGYGIFAAISTSLSRLGLGIEQAYSNRYITLSSLVLIAVLIICLKIIETKLGHKKRLFKKADWSFAKLTPIVIVVIIIGLTGTNVYKGAVQMKERNAYLLTVRDCAQNAQTVNDPCLLKLYPSSKTVWERLKYVRNIGWGGTTN